MKGSALCFWIFNILIFHANLLSSMRIIKNNEIYEFRSDSICIRLPEYFVKTSFDLVKYEIVSAEIGFNFQEVDAHEIAVQ